MSSVFKRVVHRAWLPIAAAAFVVVACSDGDGRPAPYNGLSYSGASDPNPVKGGSTGDGGTSPGADSGPVADPTCGNNTQLGQEVQAIIVDGVEPVLNGGAVQSGTYVLTDYVTYTNNPDGGGVDAGPEAMNRAARFTLTVAGNTYTFVGVRGSAGALGADQVKSSTFAIAGSTFNETTVCPVAGLTGAYQYRVTGTAIEIEYLGRREIYTRR